MLKPEQITKLAKLAKLTPEALTAAITATEEVDLTLDDTLVVLTPAELSARDASQVAIGKRTGEAEGEVKGKELAAKQVKTKLGIESDSKDLEVIAGLAVQKMAGDGALKEQVNLLQQNLTAKETELASERQKAAAATFDNNLLNMLPANRSKAIETSEHLLLIKTNLEFTEEGVKLKGQLLRDTTTTTPLTKEQAIEHFYKSRPALLEADGGGGGRGGNDDPGGAGKPKSLKQATEEWQKANPGANVGSMEYNEHMQKVIQENPEIDMATV